MSLVIVSCSECASPQEVPEQIPPEGLRFQCSECYTPFLVIVDGAGLASAMPLPIDDPPTSASLDLQAPGGPPVFASMMDPLDLSLGTSEPLDSGPELQLDDLLEPIPPSGVDLPTPKRTAALVPSIAGAPKPPPPVPAGLDLNFGGPDDAMPLPSNLPTPVGAAASGLPTPRGPTALPTPRLPSNLPTPRAAGAVDLPTPVTTGPSGNLPTPVAPGRNLPTPVAPGRNLPTPVAPGHNLPTPAAPGRNLPTPVAPGASRNLPAPVAGGRSGNLPTPSSGPSRNLPTPARPHPKPTILGIGSPSLGMELFGEDSAPAGAPALDSLNLGDEYAGIPPAFPLAPSAFSGAAPSFSSMPSFSAALHGELPPVEHEASEGAFGLTLDGGTTAPRAEPAGGKLTMPVSGAATNLGESATLPALAPLSTRDAVRAKTRSAPRPRAKLILGSALGIALAGAAAGAFLLLRQGSSGPRPAVVIETSAPELARDHFPAYGRAADALLAAAGARPDAHALRAAAAEQWLISLLARGAGRGRIAVAEQALADIPVAAEDLPAEVARARALLAIAKGKITDVERELGAAVAATPEGQLVLALRDLHDGKRESAVRNARAVIAANPGRVVALFLVGRALEEIRVADATKAYRDVLAKNPSHFGAALALARLGDDSEKRIAAVEALVKAKSAQAGPGELAEAQVAIGRAAQALGRSAEAVAALTRALALDSQSTAAIVALGEALLVEGRAQEALQRLRTLSPGGQRTVGGRFALGGAMISTGSTPEGLGMVQTAARENPRDPRGLYWAGVVAELRAPPDIEAAAQNYRAALKLDGRFLPATLKLAAMLQRQARAQDALVVLADAEKAGVPPTALRLAFGDALIVAKEPTRAEEVFRKAIEADGTLVAAHLGLASALEAQGKADAAKSALEAARVAVPDSPVVRERLAALLAQIGLKDEALALYQQELSTGKASLVTRVNMAKLALDLGRLDEALAELNKVVEENPMTKDSLFTLARVWEAKGDLGRSVAEFRKAQRFDQSPALHLAMGRVLLRAHKEPEAMDALNRAVTLAEGRIERGRVLYRKGEYDKALEDFDAAAKMAPDNAEAALSQGLCHDKLGAADAAAAAWRLALKLDGSLSEGHYRLGRLELDRGRGGSAVEHLRKAVPGANDKDAWTADLYFQLGLAEATSGSKGGAVNAYKKYLQLAAPDAPARPEAEKQIQRLGR